MTLGGVVSIFIVWYYFSPEYTDVGYAPEQPVILQSPRTCGSTGAGLRYCHSFVEVADISNIPATETCMNCHNIVKPQSLDLMPVRASWAEDTSIPWVKVHHLPDYAQFSHAVHVNNGVSCETCHGRVDQMDVVRQIEPLSMDGVWNVIVSRNNTFARTAKLPVMGYIHSDDYLDKNLERIRQEGIRPPTNCSACHY